MMSPQFQILDSLPLSPDMAFGPMTHWEDIAPTIPPIQHAPLFGKVLTPENSLLRKTIPDL